MPYTLPELPYPKNALEPHIDAMTMEIHHDKHHAAYVTNLNKALEGAGVAEQSIEDLCRNIETVPANIRGPVRNNGGGHANHSLFWTIMSPKGGGAPTGELAKAIDAELGGFDKAKADLIQAGITRFGSGWSWLSVDQGGKLSIHSTPNQDNPWMEGKTPVLGIDVWEHAYYLKYQNRRPDYLAAIWNTFDWNAINERYKAARK